MRRNNCWLAVLAVSTVLPILRHGLARERFPLDQEDTELKANRSKAAYGLDQTTPSVRTEEIDVASRNDATKLVLDASPLDQPPKKRTTIDDATKASQRIPQRGCIEDADPSARSNSVDQATMVQLDSKLASSFSLEDSRKRFAGAQTISEWTMLAGNSENSGERRLSTRISRGAVEHTSERTRAVIRADGTVRTATTSSRKRGAVDEETNRRGTRYEDLGASHYSHVGGSSRDDDSLTTPGERNFAGNRPLSGSESTDGRGRRDDGGSPDDGMTGSRNEIGDGEESSIGGDVGVPSERGYGDRRWYEDFPSGTSELDLEDRESKGLGERREVGGVRFWSLEENSRKKDQSVYDLMDGGAHSRDLSYYKKQGVKSHTMRKMATQALRFWGESRNQSVDGKGSIEEMKGQEVDRGSVELSSDYRENKVKSETFKFLSTSMPPSSSLEGGNKLVESKFDHQKQKLSKKSIDLNSSNGLYEKNQIKSETLNVQSTLMSPRSSLEEAKKLDHQEQKLLKNSIDLNSSNDNYQQNQIKSETLNVQSTLMSPRSSLEKAKKLDHQEQKLLKNSIDLNSSNDNCHQNQIKSETFPSTSLPSLTPAKLADLAPNRLSKRSLDPTSDRLKTPLKPELSSVWFDPSPDRIHPLASSSQKSSRERYNSTGIENPERVSTSRKSAEVYKDGSLELRDVSLKQRSTANNDVPEDNEPASSDRVAFPVSGTAIDVSAVEREQGNLALHTTNKDEATLTEEPEKLMNGNGYSYLGESKSVDVVNNGTTIFHFSGDSDANDMSKMENVGSIEDRGLPRVEIRDGKEDWTRREVLVEGSRKDVSNGGAEFNFPEINVAEKLSKMDNLTLIKDGVTLIEESTKLANANGNSPVKSLRTLRGTGTSDRKASVSAENPPEESETPSPIYQVAINSKENQRSSNKNNNSVNILNSTHHSFTITGTPDRKTNNPSIIAENPPEDSNSKEIHQCPNKNNNSSVNPLNSTHSILPTAGTVNTKPNNPTISTQITISTQDDSLVVKSRESQRSSIEAHGFWIPSTPSNAGENDGGIVAPEPEARIVDQTLSATGQRSISLAGTSSAVVENHEERGTTSTVSLKLNGPVTNDPVTVVKDVAWSRDSSNQNSQLSAHGIKDNEPAVGFPSGEREYRKASSS
ncbi:uncharacterized protein LOC128892993 [Hylaeus anthracinus]|uniref:uncharacterized protein LOC128892993 n=1 Tax=Hylaeus anthracinus TaxID=313031 RepID=UPI0023B8D856|nr:uncharacterized protein LOC128892993 [Hylaeus anthracinus]